MSATKSILRRENGTASPFLSEQDGSGSNLPTAQLMHNSGQLCSADKPTLLPKRSGSVARTDVRYWRKHVSKPERGDGYVSPMYSVQIAHDDGIISKRVRFPLETPNLDAAASRAQNIYLSLLANGWEATLQKFKPKAAKPVRTATVGDLIDAVRDHAGIRPITLNGYAIALRLIVSQIRSIGEQPALDANGEPIKDRKGRPVLLSRFDYKTGGRQAWVSKVDAVTLDTLTPDRIQKWKLDYIKAAGNAPDARRRAVNSVNANLRNARALFSEKALAHVKAKLLLPDPLPFFGIKLESPPTTRYISRIDAREILADAGAALDPTLKSQPVSPLRLKGRFTAPATDLGKLSPEQFKIIVLCLLCGLRKREADTLLWRQIDFKKGVLKIETTEYFQPKTEDSHAAIDLDAELLSLMQGWKAGAKGEFVIESPNLPRYHTHRANYRCQRDFQTVNHWLKSKGITAQKPVHELRKELGAVLASEQGIFAAKTVLRHSDIRLTSRFYADKKVPIYSGLGSVLAGMSTPNVIEGAFTSPAPIGKAAPKITSKPRNRARLA
jgi:integrase